MRRIGHVLIFLAVSCILCAFRLPGLDPVTKFNLYQECPLFKGSKATIQIEYKIDWPDKYYSPDVLTRMQNNILRLVFGRNASAYGLVPSFENQCKYYQALYKEAYREDLQLHGKDGWFDTWEEKMNGEMKTPYNGLVSYVFWGYEFSGGAHCNHFRTAITMDEKTGHIVRECDLFVGDYKQTLTRALRENLAKSDIISSINDPMIHPSDQFYITPKGITYVYEQHTIGAGYLGVVEVLIPWKDLYSIVIPHHCL